VQLFFQDGESEWAGEKQFANEGSFKELVLKPGDFVTKVVARTGDWCDRLEFHTKKGQKLAAGGTGGNA